jgi:hypothetical protein
MRLIQLDLMSLRNSPTPHKKMILHNLMKKYKIQQFDLIKMDIEGSEYDILMEIDRPISKQITIEFHDFRNLNPYYPDNEKYYQKLMEKVGGIYEFQDDICKKPGWMKKHERHWDFLLRIKK